MLPADFVATQGPGVRLIDMREPQAFVGQTGYIPGSDWIPPESLDSLPGRLDSNAPLIFISKHGRRAGEVARRCERRGMKFVAALGGGIAQWQSLGYATTRDPSILDRCDLLRFVDPMVPPQPQGGSPSIEQVAAHLGDPLNVRWLRLPALLLNAHLSCIDGRDDRGVIGMPGGNAGITIVVLAALERVLGRPLDEDLISELLIRQMDTLGRFYIHTDQHANESVAASMAGDSRLARVVEALRSPIEWSQFLRCPPPIHREAVLEHLCTAAAVGCGHLRSLMQHPDSYGVRPDLAHDFLRALFRLRWAGDTKIDHETLCGSHSERAVLLTRVEGDLKPFSAIPLVSPFCGGSQMFVSHPQVGSYLLDVHVDFVLQQSDLLPDLSPALRPALAAECAALTQIHGDHSVRRLAQGLPVYEVIFRKGGQYRVSHAGFVA
jgi:rhodanese-related sulfurtransferase